MLSLPLSALLFIPMFVLQAPLLSLSAFREVLLFIATFVRRSLLLHFVENLEHECLDAFGWCHELFSSFVSAEKTASSLHPPLAPTNLCVSCWSCSGCSNRRHGFRLAKKVAGPQNIIYTFLTQNTDSKRESLKIQNGRFGSDHIISGLRFLHDPKTASPRIHPARFGCNLFLVLFSVGRHL